MNKEQYLLIKLAEEASEVSKEALKCVRFGSDDRYPLETSATNRDRLLSELDDLVAVIRLLAQETEWPADPISESRHRVESKMSKIHHYMEYSRLKGILK